MSSREGQRGFTLLELIVAMTVFALIGLGLFGVLALGARSASSGERISEQARRYRVANDILARQIAAAEPIQLPGQDDEGLGEEEDVDGSSAKPFFYGDAETLEFVTNSPQRPDASGMAIVNYWVEDGTLRMSERPVFSAYSSGKLDRGRDEDDSVATILLYDVESVTFSYQRESDSDEWLEVWDAIEEEMLPAVVRVDVRPSAVGGPDFYHEIPLMVGTFNQINDVDEDFRSVGVQQDADDDGGADTGGGGKKGGKGKGGGGGGGGGDDDSPPDTVDDGGDDGDDDADDE